MERLVVVAGLVMSLAWVSNASAQTATGAISGLDNEAIVTGLVGSSFGGDFEDETVDFGGSFSWLWSSMAGAEFIAGFSPNFSLAPDVDDTMVNSYMFKGIAAAPLGENQRWQPFVSGGVGAMTLRTGDDTEVALDISEVDEAELGGNIGFEIMAFGNQWGFRGDVRYFSQLGDSDEATLFLNDLDFWRGNAGNAFRW